MSGPVLDLNDSPHPDFEERVGEIQMFLQALAVRPLDDLNLLAASWLVFVLQRVASGRDGLALLKDWNSMRFNGHSFREMLERSCAYISQVAAQRQAALDDLIELTDEVRAEQPDAYTADFDADALDARTRRHTPPPDDWLAELDDTPAVSRLRRALKSYADVYPSRTWDALRSPSQMAAAMPAKRVRHVD